ncbi:2-hydroxy-3-oxopropionate reductase [Pseudomonas chlororaphis]|uniref:2-hydroxy-3-oxopropionate reductase n=1 Tax=Pseudomonas chlororaphis TaxID=587753 RepID=A0A3G7TYH3_9PSED|nr:NAD(P)-dependent oxidoreductase [Pseudomonas chlororaphis]AZE52173.1 2-hydroxy-3-oxopropionate reductase [Pseudomonas chlororaphis]
MTNIAFIGLGAMGSRMALNLLKAGHNITVWNRNPEAAIEFVAKGVKQANSPRDAAMGADFVFSMVRDDGASRQVWLDPENGALAGMVEGCVAIESSTLSPGWVRELGEEASKRGISLLEAPVSGSRSQAESAQLIYLVGGDQATFDRCEPLLKIMGSSLHLVGPWGTGALVKLGTNALLGIQVTVLAELMGILEHSEADTARVFDVIGATAVSSPAARQMVSLMLAGDVRPKFPVELIEKDFSYAMEAAGSQEAAPTMAAARGVFQEAIRQGLGQSNMTSIVQLFVK